MPQSTEAQGVFRDPIIRANVEMLTLAMKNLALAGIMINISSDDGWHKGELMHVGEQLINGKCNDITNTDLTEADAAELEIEIYARETVEVAPPDYITEANDPNFGKLGPTVQELSERGVFGPSIAGHI
jgi:hypothetical protein